MSVHILNNDTELKLMLVYSEMYFLSYASMGLITQKLE